MAWILSLLTLYSMFWLWADLRACKLRPIIVTDSKVILRAGMRWTVEVPKTQIQTIVRQPPDDPKQSLNLSLFTAPNVYLHLKHPVSCIGPYGFQKTTSIIGAQPDEPEAFIQACEVNHQAQ